jgi:hypothetical protein
VALQSLPIMNLAEKIGRYLAGRTEATPSGGLAATTTVGGLFGGSGGNGNNTRQPTPGRSATGRSIPAPAPSRRGAERIGGGPQPFILCDPPFGRRLGRKTCRCLRKRPNPDDFDSEAIVLAVDDPIGSVCHGSPSS